MIVSDFKIASTCTPSNTILFGSTATISFKVKRERGDTFNNQLIVWYDTGYSETLAYWDYSFSLEVGETAEIEVQSNRFSDAYIEAQLENARAYPRSAWGVQFGAYGTRKNVTFSINIVKGWLPKIEYFSAVRCTGGVESDEGETLLCGLRASVSDAAELSELSLRLHYASGAVTAASPSVDLTNSVSAALAGITNRANLVGRSFSNGSDWNLMLAFGDAYEQSIVYVSIPRAFANVHLSGCATGGVAFGKFSSAAENAPKFECEYPAFFSGLVTFSGGVEGIPKTICGLTQEISVASGGYSDVSVDYSEAGFTAPPVVICGFSSGSTAGSFGRCAVSSNSATATGCTVRVFNGDSSTRAPHVAWLAIGA